MSEQAMVPVAIPSIYSITDHYDEQQIIAIDSALREKLVYEVRNEKRLSYYGVKWLVLKMADKGHRLGFMSKPDVTLVKFDDHDQHKWIWMAMVYMYNKKTTSEAYGLQESPFHEFIRNKQTGKWTSIGYDKAGRTKAVSKATRNACRQLIPEVECESKTKTELLKTLITKLREALQAREEAWDRQLEEDIKAGKLEHLREEALEEIKAGSGSAPRECLTKTQELRLAGTRPAVVEAGSDSCSS